MNKSTLFSLKNRKNRRALGAPPPKSHAPPATGGFNPDSHIVPTPKRIPGYLLNYKPVLSRYISIKIEQNEIKLVSEIFCC